MNFISTFDELSKLYEEAYAKEELTEAKDTSFKRPEINKIVARLKKVADANGIKIGPDNMKDQTDLIKKHCSDSEINMLRNAELADGTIVSLLSEELTEAAEDEEIEIADDEAAVEEIPAEEPVVEDEPRQVICECDKCGALVIKDEADIVVDEETDLVNVEDECQFCEEAKGFKIVGVVVPYEAATDAIEEPVEEEPVEESLHNSELLKEIEKTNELKTEHESEHLTLNEEADEEADDIIDEDLADVFRKKFDRPASVTTQQWWEAELTDLQLELEHETDERKKAKIEKRIKQLEDKFLQQRDWEGRHAKKDAELDELFDAKVKVDATNFAGNNNKVSVLGLESVDVKKLAKENENDDDLDELFDAKINLDARGFGGSGNDVSVL
jgi:hypothetical protein